MLEIRNLTAAYGKHRALENASLIVRRGEIVVILGANGAGKSTLLKAICGICEGKVQGSVTMNGHELMGERADRIVEEGIALVPEGRGIFGDLSVEENLLLGAHAPRAKGDEQANLERVYALFPKLRERRRQVSRTMSGGEQQMVAIGRAMMSNPAVLALDEPSLGLSPLLCKELFASLKEVRKSGIGILLVEQNARASLAIADRGYLLENTHIIHEGSGEALAKDPAVQKAYLGGAAAKAPLAAPAVQPHPSAPSPQTGPAPADIAVAAMQQFGARKPAPPATIVTPPIQTAPPMAAPKPVQPVAPPQPATNGKAHGIDVNSLVARARDVSSSRPAPVNGSGRAPATNGSAAPRPVLSTSMPDLSAHGDRLQTVLQEIEAAATRARQRSQTRYGPMGRKSD